MFSWPGRFGRKCKPALSFAFPELQAPCTSNEKLLNQCLFPTHMGGIWKPSEELNAPFSLLSFDGSRKITYLAAALLDPPISGAPAG